MSVLVNYFYCLMKNSRKLDSPNRSIIDKKKKKLVNSDSHDNENSDVLVSAVISPYLLTHLHHILQQSEYYAQKDGRKSHAANFAKLRKVLCLDARSMADASAKEIKDTDNDLSINKYNEQNVAWSNNLLINRFLKKCPVMLKSFMS